jgi:putative tricarboxylic transport membrane protein
MSAIRTKDTAVGLAMLAAGLGYLYLTTGLPRRGSVDATFIPYVLAGGMILLGLLQTFVGWRRHDADAEETPGVDDEAPSSDAPANYMTVVKTLVLFATFTALLRPLGFPVAASLYLFFQFIVLTPDGRTISYWRYAALAISGAVITFVSFRYGFDLILPAGPLTPYLP